MSTFSHIFSSEITGPIEAKFLWDGGTEICSNGPGHMAKMADMPIYMVKSLKNLLLQNQMGDHLETWYAALGAQVLPSLFK